MKRTAYRKRKNQVIFLTVSFIILLSVCLIFGAFLVSARENTAHETDTYYKSVRIQSGDTLWDIAEENITADYGSVDEYVRALKDINSLDSDFIQSGQYLIIECSN